MPLGYELTTLVHGIVEAGRAEPALSAASRERLATLERDVDRRRLRHADLTALPAGRAAGVQAARSRRRASRAAGIEASEFAVEADRHGVHAVPAIVVDGALRLGRLGAGGGVRRSGAGRRSREQLVRRLRSWTRLEPRRTTCSTQYADRSRVAELPPRHRGLRRRTRTSATDIDGMSGDRDELLAIQRAYGIARLVHVLPRRARPPPRVHRGERPHARVREPRRRASSSRSSASTSTRRPIEEATTLPRPRRARDQAPPPRAALPPRRPAARAGLRARRGAPRADPDPRRPRAAADRGLARAARSTATARRR